MNSIFLEVGIGLAVVFVLVATVIDGVNEFITRTLNTRSKALWASLEGMLAADPKKRPEIGLSFVFRSVLPGSWRGEDHRPDATAGSDTGSDRATALLLAPSIRGLDYVRSDSRRTKIWTISGDTFASAIREIAKSNASANAITLADQVAELADDWKGSPLGDYLGSVAIETTGTTDQFLDSVAAWFDHQMDRLRLTFRRNVKWALGIMGLLAALVLNIDAIRITQSLRDDAQLRTAVTTLSATIGTDDSIFSVDDCEVPLDSPDNPNPADRRLLCALDNLSTLEESGLPVLDEDWTWVSAWSETAWGDGFQSRVGHLAGILLTGGAISLGGTFWWDFLRNISGMRGRLAAAARHRR